MNKLTKEQANIISGYTGYLCSNFKHFHEDVEKRLGHPVFTHEFGSEDFTMKLQRLYRDDFMKICFTN